MKWTPIVSIVSIVILECVALTQGVNGTVFSLVIAAVAGLGGYQIKARLQSKNGGK